MARDAEPTRVGRYEVLSELGRGGMATVHLARQLDLDRLVALKRLDGLAEESDVRVRRFVREARLAASLSHPNIVTVHDAFEVDGVAYIAMELVPGGTLRPLLTASRWSRSRECSTACSPASTTRSATTSCTATSSPRT